MTRKYFAFCAKSYREIIKDIENTGDYEFKIRVDIDDLENEQICSEIKEQLEHLVRYNSVYN